MVRSKLLQRPSELSGHLTDPTSQGIASHLIVAKYDKALPGSPQKANADLALKLYWAQYALNLAWTPVNGIEVVAELFSR